MSIPATRALPLLGRSRPTSILMVVVLPAPLGPRKPNSSPAPTSRSRSSTGLRLQVFDLDAHPLTAVEDYPRYCRLLQERKACPLYNDPAFLKRGEETIGVCKSGVGHFIAPVGNEKEVQIGAVVSPAVRFA